MCHRRDAATIIKGGTLRSKSKIANALVKYGFEAFTVEIVSRHLTKVALDQAEMALIKEMDSIHNGYNILPGGQGMPSNSSISDQILLNQLHEIRSRGAKTANANRWGSATKEDRQRWRDRLINGRLEGDWQKNIQASWDQLSKEDRQERGRQMKEGRLFRFVLKDRDGKEVRVETNLRSLLADLVTDTPKKQIERIVRNDNIYSTQEFSIEKRHR
jgi:hypothetical protein